MRRSPFQSMALYTIVAVAAGLIWWSRPAGPQMLPDLAMAAPADLTVGVGEDGSMSLLFSAMVVNVGDGPFLVDAEWDRDTEGWSVVQTIQHEQRGTTVRQVDPEVGYSGDGHDHFHILDTARYRLTPLDPDQSIDERFDNKVGFCFFDRDRYAPQLPGAPSEPVFQAAACGGAAAQVLSMGLSVGWGDNYYWNFYGQSIDITGLPNGDYRLDYSADPDGWFEEADEANNSAWARITLVTEGPEPSVVVHETGVDR